MLATMTMAVAVETIAFEIYVLEIGSALCVILITLPLEMNASNATPQNKRNSALAIATAIGTAQNADLSGILPRETNASNATRQNQ